MTRELPDWRPFDPSDGSVSTPSAPPSADDTEGRVVIVAPTASVERGGWAGRAAVALARQWGRAGTKVFLADLSVRRPVLHEVVGVENGEGITDALLYGASIRRIAISTGEPFFFAPAGTVVADPEPILDHPRWAVLSQGFADAGVTLVLYAPLALPGTASLMERAGEVVLLATESEAPGTDLQGADGKVTLVMGPGRPAPVGPAYDEGDVPAETSLDRPGGEAPAAGRAPAGPTPAEAARARPAPGTGRPEGAATRATRKRSSRIEVLVLLLVLILGGAILGAYYGYLDVPWLTPYLEQLDGGEDAAPPEGTDATPSPSPAGEGAGDASHTLLTA